MLRHQPAESGSFFSDLIPVEDRQGKKDEVRRGKQARCYPIRSSSMIRNKNGGTIASLTAALILRAFCRAASARPGEAGRPASAA
jgi:hypothetical protein